MAYVELSSRLEVASALGLSGQLLLGQPLMVKSSEAEKNVHWESAQQAKQQQQQHEAQQALDTAATHAGAGMHAAAGDQRGPYLAAVLGARGIPSSAVACRLQVSNLQPELQASDVQALFAPFGRVGSMELARDPHGASQGMAYVTFAEAEDASSAMAHWHKRRLGDRVLSVQPAAVVPPPAGSVPQSTSAAITSALSAPPPATLGGPGAAAAEGPGELLEGMDAGSQGVPLTAARRAALMARLAHARGLHLHPPPAMQSASSGADAVHGRCGLVVRLRD